MKLLVLKNFDAINYTPASEANREVANLTERKNQHTPVYGVKEFLSVCLSVCLFLQRGNLAYTLTEYTFVD